MLLALGAVRQHLAPRGLRARVALVAEAGVAFDPHNIVALVGYGAEAVHRYMALETVRAKFAGSPEHGRRHDEMSERPGPGPGAAQERYRSAVGKGLLKIIAKMGMSTLASFGGAQILEVLGLGVEVIDHCLAGTISPMGALGFRELGDDALAHHAVAYPPASSEGSAAIVPEASVVTPVTPEVVKA